MATPDADRRLLDHAAARAEERSFFLASALAAYRRLSGFDDARLAAWLECRSEALSRLGLCRRPDGETAMFVEDVQRIAAFAGASAARLASLLRAVENAEAMRGRGAETLMAAHDRERPAAGDAPGALGTPPAGETAPSEGHAGASEQPRAPEDAG